MANQLPAAVEFANKFYGGQFQYKVTKYVMGDLLQQIAKPDPERVGFTVMNIGTNEVYIAPDQEVGVGYGLELLSAGSSVTMNARDDLILPSLGWWARGTAAGTTIFVIEVSRFSYAPPPGQ